MADKKVFKRRKRGGRSCAAGAPNNQSCRNRTFTPGISMHQFPVDPAIRDQWVKFVRQHRPEFHESSSKYHSLCSAHFEDHCYVHNLSVVGSVLEGAGFKLQKMLSRQAIPTKDASTNVTERRVKLPITTLNQHITCRLCNGYLVDAATITECLHTFCKSCLVRHIELVNRCPTCNTLIHESQPLYNIRLDRTMQDIVYKLLPRLEREEKRRERKFYKDRQLPYPVPKVLASQTLPVPGPSKAIKKQKDPIAKTSSKTAVTKSYHRTDEQISLQLETFRDGSGGPAKIEPLQKKYMRLSTQVTIGLIQRFLAAKLQLKSENMVGILYDKTEMGKDLTLKYINDNLSPQEEHSSGPLILHYRALDIKT